MKQSIELKLGVYCGIAVIAYFLLFYFVNPKLFFNTAVSWGVLVVYVFFILNGLSTFKAQHDNQLDFRAGIKVAFNIFVIGALFFYLFYYVLFNFIDPNMVTIQKEAMLDSVSNYESILGEEGAAEMRKNVEEQELDVRFGRLFMQYGISLIGGFFMSALLTLIVQRGRPRKTT